MAWAWVNVAAVVLVSGVLMLAGIALIALGSGELDTTVTFLAVALAFYGMIGQWVAAVVLAVLAVGGTGLAALVPWLVTIVAPPALIGMVLAAGRLETVVAARRTGQPSKR